MPACRTEMARSASSSVRCCRTRLHTSKMTIVGTMSSALRVMAASKKPAFGPSAKYSSQAEESTRFTFGPRREVRGYRYRAGSLASVWHRGWESIRSAHYGATRETCVLERDRALHAHPWE